MLETLSRMLPFLIAGAFLPTWTSRIILMLGTQRPVATAAGFIAGNWTFRFGLGVTALYVTSVAAPRSGDGFRIPSQALLGAGLILAVTGLLLLLRRPESAATQEMPPWPRAFRGLPPWVTFTYGFVTVASPGIQWVYFLGGMGVLAEAELPFAETIALLAVYCTLLQSMLVAPVAIYVRKRDAAERVFGRMELWLAQNGSVVVACILIAVGLVLVIDVLFLR